MSKPLTAAEQNEIVEYVNTHPHLAIDRNEDGWCILFPNGGVHPRTFLDVIRSIETGGDDVIKSV